MSEFRFFAYTDFAFITNRSQNLVNLPITPFLATKPATSALASDEPSTELNIPYTVFEILVAIVSIIGNLMVIIVFRRERKLRRRTNYYIVSLAMADFLVGSLGVPFAILASIGLPRNLYACLFTVSLLVVLCTISIFCLVAVSVDRYWAILYPMAYSRNVRTRTAIVIISMCWVAGAVVGFLPLFGWHADVDHNQACLFVEVMDYNYLVFLYFATIITPALLMLAFYAHIYRVIIKQVRQIVTMNPASDLSRRSSTAQIQISTPGRIGCHGGTMLRVLGAARKRDVKATQNLSIIVLFFMICWIPLYTINCIKAFCPTCYVHPKLTLFCIILSHLNSAVNPVLYAYHLKDFRAALKNLLLKIMGVEIDQQAEAIHRFSLASQHRLQSMDSRSMQPRMYIDSPIWLRQQQEALKNSQLLPKCGVVSPCFNNIHQTVAAVASVTTDIEREMWNIVEASSGAEHGEVSYEFHSDKIDSDRDSSMSPTNIRRTSHQLQQQRHQRRYDSTYSYDNHNFSSSNDDNDDENNDDDDGEVEYEDVFITKKNRNPNAPVDPMELRKSLIACVLREKLRSDDSDHQTHQRALSESYYGDIFESQRNSANTSATSPTNGQLTMGSALSRDTGDPLSKCLPAAAAVAAATTAVYVINSDTHPLRSPGHKPKYRKPAILPKNSREISRSCSCTSESSSPARDVVPLQVSNNSLSSGETLTKCANSTSQRLFSNKNHHFTFHTFSSNSIPKQQQQNVELKRQFSPLRTVGNFMFQPISKHSSLFHIFQTTSTTTATTSATTTTTQPTNTIAKAISSVADLREASAATTTTSTSTMTSTALNAMQEQIHNDIIANETPTMMASASQLPLQLPSLVNSNNINSALSTTDADNS